MLPLLLLVTAACRQDMNDQHKVEPMEQSAFFADGRGDRPLVPDTVPLGHLRTNDAFYIGRVNGAYVPNPRPLTAELLTRGQERYNIFCAVCHDRTGGGQGTIVRRGFRQPPTYHSQRLREMPDGYLYEVITRGFGAMQSYADRVPPADRWAIVAYIRALQFSQDVDVSLLTDAEREKVENGAIDEPKAEAEKQSEGSHE